tara:strand:+ start:420 stop:845 length:426 start_codon:yes stop_codon:yes gene_type:complete
MSVVRNLCAVLLAVLLTACETSNTPVAWFQGDWVIDTEASDARMQLSGEPRESLRELYSSNLTWEVSGQDLRVLRDGVQPHSSGYRMTDSAGELKLHILDEGPNAVFEVWRTSSGFCARFSRSGDTPIPNGFVDCFVPEKS